MLEVYLVKKLWHFTLELQFTISDQIMVLWGPSGSGKTTVLQCLAGLRKPSSGRIELNGQTLYSSGEGVDIPVRSRKVGYLFQDYALFPHLTIKQNVLYGVPAAKRKSPGGVEEAAGLLTSFGVGHLLDRYPGQLSGGERQRVALARALATNPEWLLLDEPFSALDKSNRMKLRQELKKLHQQWKIPFILVSHDEDDACYLGGMVVGLNRGKSPAGAFSF